MSSPVRLMLLAALVLFVHTSADAQVFPAPEGELKSEYDRFTDQRKIRLFQLQVSEKSRHDDLDPIRLYVSLAAFYRSGLTPQPPEVVTVIFEAWTLWGYEFNGAAPLHAIVDGQRRSYGSAVFIKNLIVNGKYVSQVGGNMAYSDFLELIKGKNIEMRLGRVEFALPEKAQGKFRDFAGMITP